jgi:Tol biopolymer transport system component
MKRAPFPPVLVAMAIMVAGLAVRPAPARATFPGPTGRIAFDDFITGQIYAVNPDGTGMVQLTHEPEGFGAVWPDWSPDGSHLLFTRFNTSNGLGRIWIMNANGSHQHKVTSDAPGFRDYQPNYTPDGRHIVFPRCKPHDGVCAIWIMRSDGTDKEPITPYKEGAREAVDFGPSVSPDGRLVAYTAFGQNGVLAQIHIVRLNGSGNHPVSPPPLEAFGPDWSPDGTHITFASNAARLNSNLYSMNADGTGIAKLTTTKWPNNNIVPVYSPGGGQIAFSSDRRYPDLCCLDLFVMSADGTAQRLIHTGLQGVIDAAWGTAPLLPATSSSVPSGRPLQAPSLLGTRKAGCLGMPEVVARAVC